MEGTNKTPLIGVTVDWIETTERSESMYCVRKNYVNALAEAGARAVLLPLENDSISTYLEICDGFLVTGSQPGDSGSALRRSFDAAIILAALNVGKPVMGICNGMQMIGDVLGSRLVTIKTDSREGNLEHCPNSIPIRVAHKIEIEPNSLLSRIAKRAGVEEFWVNSLHTEALSPEGNFRVTARADNEVVEALEVADHPFALGVQWHPEYQLSKLDRAIFKAFGRACLESRRY